MTQRDGPTPFSPMLFSVECDFRESPLVPTVRHVYLKGQFILIGKRIKIVGGQSHIQHWACYYPLFLCCCFFRELIFRRIMARRLSWINFIRTQNAGRTRLNHLLLCHGSTSKRSVVNNQPRSAAQSMSAVCTAASMCLCDWALILTAIFYNRNMGWHLAENSVDSSIF